MSGYTIKVTAFLPCGKNAAEHNIAFQKIEALHDALAEIGFVEVDVIDEFKPNRKSASRAGSHGESPTPEAPEEKRPPDASSGAGLDLPGFLDRRSA